MHVLANWIAKLVQFLYCSIIYHACLDEETVEINTYSIGGARRKSGMAE